MSDAITRGPDDVPRKSDTQQVIDLEAVLGVMNQMMQERDAEIRELKARNEYLTAALDQMLGQFEERHVWVPTDNKPYLHFEWEGYGIDGHYCADAPELTRYLCERNGWPNPLENTNDA